MQKSTLAVAVLSSLLCCGQVWAAPEVPKQSRDIANQFNTQMNRTREYFERERVAEQIAADRANAKNKVEGQATDKNEQKAPNVTFKLQKITTDPSTVLTDAELNGITANYIGKNVAVKDLYDIVAKINDLYAQKGYMTCRAFLPAQTIKDGTVKITLIEGKTGTAEVVNNKFTKAKYITNRLHLAPGAVANINELNKDLLRFNATNDAQLRIVMQAGKQPGTTDYVIQTYEPQEHNVSLFMDNAGNYSSGDFRTGLFYTVRSLSGNRDALSIGTLRSEGTKAGSASYSRSIGRSGTKLNLSYSSNSVHQVRNDDSSHVLGHAAAYNVGIVQPWIVNDKTRSEVSLEYGRQDSKSDIVVPGWRTNIVSDQVHDVTAAFAMTNYGKSHVLYQKHSYTRGYSESTPEYYVPSSQNYGFYKFSGLYQKVYKHGQLLNARLDAQWSGTDNMVSARQYYIGGMYSVRGYKENYMGGDSGLTFSAEYSVPITKDKNTSAFIFYDFGKVYGESAESNGDERILTSAGLGIKTTINKRYYACLTLGCPLKTEFAGKADKVSKTRINFILSGQF